MTTGTGWKQKTRKTKTNRFNHDPKQQRPGEAATASGAFYQNN
jgi:hypothetical protein